MQCMITCTQYFTLAKSVGFGHINLGMLEKVEYLIRHNIKKRTLVVTPSWMTDRAAGMVGCSSLLVYCTAQMSRFALQGCLQGRGILKNKLNLYYRMIHFRGRRLS